MEDRRRHRGRERRRTRQRPARTLVAGIAMGFWATAAVAGGVAPAGGGGGDSMEPARDRYEPGQTVTMIGYGFVVVDRPPYEGAAAYHGFLRRAGHDGDGGTPSGTDLGWPGRRLGPATIDEVEPHWGRNVRVSVEFSLPDDLAPGVYEVDVCTSGCDAPLGSFLPSPVHVGMDAPWPVTRDWPLSDPAIRWLEDDALIGTVGGTVTAADVRAGRAVDPPPGMQAPLPEEAAAPAAPDSPPVQAAGSASSGSAGGTTGRSGATSPADGPTGAADVVATDEPGTDGAVGPWLPVIGTAVLAAVVAGRWLVGDRRRIRGSGGDPATPILDDALFVPDDERPTPDHDAAVRV